MHKINNHIFCWYKGMHFLLLYICNPLKKKLITETTYIGISHLIAGECLFAAACLLKQYNPETFFILFIFSKCFSDFLEIIFTCIRHISMILYHPINSDIIKNIHFKIPVYFLSKRKSVVPLI